MDNEKFGNFIKELRKEKNLTQKQLADKINITDKAISKSERGLSFPDITMLNILSKELNVSVEELLKTKKQDYSNNKIKDLINLILKAVAIAMGIGVVVLNILDKIEIKASIIILGIGMFCIGLYLLDSNEKEK